MASHPDSLYSSLLKMSEFCANQLEEWSLDDSNVWRLFFWNPVLIIKDNLFILQENEEEKYNLIETSNAKLEFNFYYKDEPKTFLIDIVTENGLLEYLKSVITIDDKMEAKLFELYQKTNNEE